jgi:uncharacterized protein involved in outer membrane biogenesis
MKNFLSVPNLLTKSRLSTLRSYAVSSPGRRMLGGFGLLVLVVALGASVLYWFFSGDSVRIALEQQATAWLGQPVRIGRAAVTFLPRPALRLDEVRIGEPARLTLARVDLSTNLRSLMARRIEDGEVIVSGSRVEMPLPFAVPAMSAPAAAAASGGALVAGGGMELASIRAITLRDVVLASRGRAVTVSADSALSGSRLAILSFTARSGDTELSAHGAVELAPRMIATIDATANELDFDDLLALAAAFTTNSTKTPTGATSAQVTAKVTAPRARVAGVALAGFEATMVADGADVRIEPLQFDMFGGRYTGSLDATFGDMLDVRIGAGMSNLDVAQLAAYGGIPNTVTGRLSGSGHFGARGRTMSEVLSAARGSGEIKISSGTIHNLDVVRTVVSFLGHPAANSPPATGERFDTISATFTLADRTLRSDNLTLQSPDVDIQASGTLVLPTETANLHANLVLSESLSAQAGRDVYRFTRAGKRIVLPAIIQGPLGQPRISIDTAAVVRRGLQNELGQGLQNLFERVAPGLP